ncbi:hypothetical protein ACWD5R_42765 [Streptomyces sp. NPDC002514]|uniref:hypothetical protein n=1 Tax=Streptomyces sp. NPDC001270 TaxID=3364554 RepID=UPI0036B5F4D7
MTGDEQLSGGVSTGSRDVHDDVEAIVRARHGARIAAVLEREPVWARDFTDLTHEGRRLFGEGLGTFLLVLAGAGAALLETALTVRSVGPPR